MRNLFAILLIPALLSCNKAEQATVQVAPVSSKAGVLASVSQLASQIDDPKNSAAFRDPQKVKQHLEFIQNTFRMFPQLKQTVEGLHGELLASAAPANAVRGRGAMAADACEVAPAGNNCPRVCAYAAATAAAWTCATAHAIAQAWAVAQATAMAACPDGSFSWGTGFGYGWATDEQFVTVCSQAFGYGYAWACTDGTSGAGAGAGVGGGIWTNFAGGAMANSPSSNATTTPRPLCVSAE